MFIYLDYWVFDARVIVYSSKGNIAFKLCTCWEYNWTKNV